MIYNTDLQPLPTNAEELERCLADPIWRIFSGCLYKIKIKGDDFVNELGQVEEAPTYELPFKPNDAQMRFLNRLWYRNIILKARQLGFTTLISVLWLDHALFNANQHCGVIAQNLETVGDIFTDKIKFAYDNLPPEILERFPLKTNNGTEMEFAHNGSKISVATSFRGGTMHRLLISEYGKICAQSPGKAKEVRTGSLPAVPTTGICVIESTAEGRGGDFFDKVQIAQKNFASRKRLTPKDFRLHFYGWWEEPKYRIDSSEVVISLKDHNIFDHIEIVVSKNLGKKIKIDPDQRAWYISTRDNDLSGDQALMWQEYPYVSNDIQRIRLKVVLDDVPSSTTFREQQLNALSEITKSLSAEIQTAVLPYVMALTDIPFKKDIIESIRQATQAPTPEQVEQQIKEAVERALADAGIDLKRRELELKERKAGSEIREIDARSVQIGVQAAYSAMQAGAQVAQMPQIAPVADEVMKGAGYQRPNPLGDDPNFPTAEQTAARDVRSPYLEGEGAQIGSEGLAEVQQNTSPMNPAVPKQGGTGMEGIETGRSSDNF